jgi:hypothetical protein
MSAQDIIRSLFQAGLDLQDEEKIEQFWFLETGLVVATLGTKGSAICGPTLNYCIGDDGSITIGKKNESFLYRWEQLSLSENELTVVCNGTTKRFSISRPLKKERFLP